MLIENAESSSLVPSLFSKQAGKRKVELRGNKEICAEETQLMYGSLVTESECRECRDMSGRQVEE